MASDFVFSGSAATGFEDYLRQLDSAGSLTERSLSDEKSFGLLINEYSKTIEDPVKSKLAKIDLESYQGLNIRTAGDFLVNEERIRSKKQSDQDVDQLSSALAASQKTYDDMRQSLATDGALGFSVDQAQKTAGEGIQTIGDALQGDLPITVTGLAGGWIGEWASRIGKNIVEQQDVDIKKGGYVSSYKGSFLDQDVSDMAGWTLEKIAENSVTSGTALIGAAAAAAAAPVSGALAVSIGAGTAASSSLLAIGDVASELKEKGVYDSEDAGKAVAIGLLSGALDTVGAGKVIPKGAVINKLFRDGTVDAVAKDIAKSGVLKSFAKGAASEGLTEVLQEGITVAYAASEGADYEADELINRFVDSAVVGGTMGGAFGATQSGVSSAIESARLEKDNPNLIDVTRKLEDQSAQDEQQYSTFTGDNLSLLSPQQTRSLVATTIRTESGGQQDIVNEYGYAGLYQFGASALTDVGLIRKDKLDKAGKNIKRGLDGHREFLENPENWTIEGGLDAFLGSREIQDKAFVDLANRNIKTGLRTGAITEESDAGHISGFIKAAHLVGAGGASDYVLSGSDKDDANGTTASKYYAQGRDSATNTKAYRDSIGEERPSYRSPKKQIRDSNLNKHNVTYEVVEADSIQPTVDKSINQYRDRNRVALQDQVSKISSQLDYGLLDADSSTFDSGSPAMAVDGSVVAGNGRVLGIQKAYQDGGAEDYRAGLIGDAEYIGVDRATIEAMDKPVLIRRLAPETDISQLAILSNKSLSAGQSNLEIAKVDAESIGSLEDFNPTSDGDLTLDSAFNLFQRLSDSPTVTDQERNELTTADDKDFSQYGYLRMRNAILYMAYGDSDVLANMVENANPTSINTLKGLTAAAPNIAEMKDSISKGLIYDADITDNLIASVDLFSQVKKQGRTVDSLLESDQLVGEQIPEEVRVILRKLDETTRSPNKLRDFLISYTQLLKDYGNPNNMGLFGGNPEPDTLEVLQRAEQGTDFRRADDAATTQPAAGSARGTENQSGLNFGSGSDSSTVGADTNTSQKTNAEPRPSKPDVSSVIPGQTPTSREPAAEQPTQPERREPVNDELPTQQEEPVVIENNTSTSSSSASTESTSGTDSPGTVGTSNTSGSGGGSGGQPPRNGGREGDFESAGGPIEPRDSSTNFADGDTRDLKTMLTDKIRDIGSFLGRKFAAPTTVFGESGIQAAERLSAVDDVVKHDVSIRIKKLDEISKQRYTKYGITSKVAQDRYDYLTTSDQGIKEAIDLFPEEKQLLDEMRRDLDKTSNEFIDLIVERIADDFGIDVSSADFTSDKFIQEFEDYVAANDVEGLDVETFRAALQSAGNIKQNIGTYITRTYAANTHPETWNSLVLDSTKDHFVKTRKDVEPFFMDQARRSKPELEGQDLIDHAKQQMRNFVTDLSEDGRSTGIGSSETVLLARSELLDNSPELRRLLGEHTEVETAFANATHRMKKTLATKRFYNEMMASVESRGETLGTEQDHTEGMRKINVKNGKVVRNPFSGLYADPATADFIERVTDSDVGKTVENLMMINGIWQLTHTVASIPTAVGNVISAIPVMMATATGGKHDLQDTFRAINYAFSITDKSQESGSIDDAEYLDRFVSDYGMTPNEMYQYAIENQLTSGGALGGETEKYIQEGGLDALGRRVGVSLNSAGVPENLTDAAGAGLGKTVEGFQTFYNIGDSIPKLAIFFNETRRLTELNKKYGDGFMPKDQILIKASNLAKQQAPQYSRIPEVVDMIRKFPFVGQFVAFQSQMYQTMHNQAKLSLAMMQPEKNAEFLEEHMGINVNFVSEARQEPIASRRGTGGLEGSIGVDGPEALRLEGSRDSRAHEAAMDELKSRGRTRAAAQLATVAFYTTALGGVLGAAASIFGDDDDMSEEELEAISSLNPDYYRFIDKQYVGRDDEGNPRFVNTSRLDMYGGSTDALKIPFAYANGDIEDLGDATFKFIDAVFSPFYEPTFVSKTIAAAVTNKDQYDRAIVMEEDGLIGNAGNVASYLANELLNNGTVKGFDEIIKDFTAEEKANDRTGIPYSTSDAAATFAGLKPMTFDANKQTLFWMYRLKGEERDLRSRLTGKLKSFHKLSPEDVSTLISDARAEHHKIYDTLRDKINSARTVGLSDEQIAEAAGIVKFGKTDYRKFIANDLNPPFLLKELGQVSTEGVYFRNVSKEVKDNFSSNYTEARTALNNLPKYLPE